MGRLRNINRKLQKNFMCFYAVLVTCCLLLLVGSFQWLKVVIFKEPKCWDTYGNLFDIQKMHISDSAPFIYPGGTLPDRLKYEYSFNLLPRVSNTHNKESLFALLQDFLEMLQENGIEYFMAQGTLLGSYFFHDLIPWDDDIDLFVHIKDVNKLRALFRSQAFRKYYEAHSFHDPVNMYSRAIIGEDIPDSNTHFCRENNPDIVCHQQGKIYLKNSSHAGVYEWRYPFVDFIFYTTNKTHMYNHEMWERDGRIEIKLSDFYPFHLRPYNRIWIPAPHQPLRFLHAKFSHFSCKQSFWNHSQEHRAYTGWPLQVDCARTKMCYARVRRREATQQETEAWVKDIAKNQVSKGKDAGMKVKDVGEDVNDAEEEVTSRVVEELVLGDVIIQSVFLDEQYEGQFDLTLTPD